MKKKYKHIHFEAWRSKTNKWYCHNNKTADVLGIIDWYGPWQCWTFWPANSDVVFSADCLDNISHFMKQLPKHP